MSAEQLVRIPYKFDRRDSGRCAAQTFFTPADQLFFDQIAESA